MAKISEEVAAADGTTPSQPGTVISPGGQISASIPAAPAPEQAVQPPEPAISPEPVISPEPPTTPAEPEDSLATVNDSATEQVPVADDDSEITWTASEFIAHEKTGGWYLGLIIAGVVLAAAIYWLTKDLVSPIVVIAAAVLLAVFGSHKPRQLEYHLNGQGIQIGGQTHAYHEFRSFSVIPEGAFSSIVFMPLKRFALPLTLYYAPQDEDRIVQVLSDQLPLENRRPDPIDSLMRRIRF